MPDMPKVMDQTDWSLLFLLSVLWGATFVYSEVALEALPPMTIVLARVSLAALALLPLLWLKGIALPRTMSQWRPFLIMGILNNAIPFSLINAGQIYVTAGTASVLNATTPLFTVLIMAATREEALTHARIAGIVLGIAGVAVLSGAGSSAASEPAAGILCCLLAAVSYGFSALWGRRHLRDEPPVRSAACQLLCSTAVMAVIVAVADQPWKLPWPGSGVWAALAGMALLSTALAYLVFFSILVRAGASNVMLVTLLIPASAMVMGAVWLGEPVTPRQILGAAIIAAGLLVIDGRIFRFCQRKS